MAFNKINFSAEAEKDLIPAWKDYVNHYRKVFFSIVIYIIFPCWN